MSQVQVKCQECGKLCEGFKQLKLHSCNQENQKTGSVTDFTKNDTSDTKSDYVEEDGKKKNDIPEDGNQMDFTESDQDTFTIEEKTKNTLMDINNFIKEKGLIFKDLDEELTKSKDAIKNANSPLEPISAIEIEDTEPFAYPKPPTVSHQPPRPPLQQRRRTNKSEKTFFKSNQCPWCGLQNTDRIRLAKHLISEHWLEVREEQGGGRIDNSRYYAHGIEDSRILKVKQNRLVTRTVQRDPVVQRQAKEPGWLGRLETNKKITNASRNLQNSQLRGRIPNRKMVPKVSYVELRSESRSPTSQDCEVCDDEFSWPDDEHRKVCVRTRNQQNKGQTNPVKNKQPSRSLVEQKRNSNDIRKPTRTLQSKQSAKEHNSKDEFNKIIKQISHSNIKLGLTPIRK